MARNGRISTRGKRPNPKYLLAPEGQAYCCLCDMYKSVDSFGKNKQGYEGLHFYCRDCVGENSRRQTENNALRQKTNSYGISPKEYIELLEKHHHVCAICGKPETRIHQGVLAALSIDHDHDTGKIRGLLCTRCNSAIGHFYEDVEIMRKAIDYLNINGAQAKSKTYDDWHISHAKEKGESLRQIAHGLPKKLTGSQSDAENLPLFAIS